MRTWNITWWWWWHSRGRWEDEILIVCNNKTNLGPKLGELDQFDMKIEQNFSSALRLCNCAHFGSEIRLETPIWTRTQFGMRHRTKKEGDLIWKAVLVAKNSKLVTSRLLCSQLKNGESLSAAAQHHGSEEEEQRYGIFSTGALCPAGHHWGASACCNGWLGLDCSWSCVHVPRFP